MLVFWAYHPSGQTFTHLKSTWSPKYPSGHTLTHNLVELSANFKVSLSKDGHKL